MAEQNKSIGWVVGMLALVVTYFGWAFVAMDYFRNHPDGGVERRSFWLNSILQLPNLPSVISYAFTNRLWLIILIAVVEAIVVVLWIVMRKLERELGHK